MKKKQNRIHLYYPLEDQALLEDTVMLSRFTSASALVRELVRRYHRTLERRDAKRRARNRIRRDEHC